VVKSRERVDVLLVRAGLAPSRTAAARRILAGEVRADGEMVWKPSQLMAPDVALEVRRGPRYVSRGGEKLEAALQAFAVPVAGRSCADVGASTGGFTDCLLQHGAARVYAVDVGRGQLHWSLRKDPRVVSLEGVNARRLTALPEPVHVVTADVSFISLRHIVPVASDWLLPGGDLVALVKPQFEAGRQQVGKGGVVRDRGVRRESVLAVARACRAAGLGPRAARTSPLRGPKGNVEYFLWCRKGDAGLSDAELQAGIADD
jgi:23S rRNA (cytidine1920-2'-O)/16S rRNA (cytidine1409-2'-O)-methyltransferase